MERIRCQPADLEASSPSDQLRKEKRHNWLIWSCSIHVLVYSKTFLFLSPSHRRHPAAPKQPQAHKVRIDQWWKMIQTNAAFSLFGDLYNVRLIQTSASFWKEKHLAGLLHIIIRGVGVLLSCHVASYKILLFCSWNIQISRFKRLHLAHEASYLKTLFFFIRSKWCPSCAWTMCTKRITEGTKYQHLSQLCRHVW